jgi:hypothetical protein
MMDNQAQREREAVVAWLRAEALTVRADKFSLPTWRLFLWCIFNPREFSEGYGRFRASIEAADAIEAGDHLDTKGAGNG